LQRQRAIVSVGGENKCRFAAEQFDCFVAAIATVGHELEKSIPGHMYNLTPRDGKSSKTIGIPAKRRWQAQDRADSEHSVEFGHAGYTQAYLTFEHEKYAIVQIPNSKQYAVTTKALHFSNTLERFLKLRGR